MDLIGILFCVEVVCVADLHAVCMCCVRVLISNSICLSSVRSGFMFILLQSLLCIVQYVCSVFCVCLAILYRE